MIEIDPDPVTDPYLIGGVTERVVKGSINRANLGDDANRASGH
jgi:hypothetical protein